MNRVPVAVVIFVCLVVTFIPAALLRAHTVAGFLAISAALVAAVVFGGHFVTIDDDYPGGWSNPEHLKTTWATSLRELAVKLAIFVATGSAAAWYWFTFVR